MRKGLIVGKFSPLHKGHEWMIEQAMERCDELVIMTYSNPELGYPVKLREYWLEYQFPSAIVVGLDPAITPMPHNDARDLTHQLALVNFLIDHHHHDVDVLFCSESWGPACAKVLSRELERQVDVEIMDVDRTIVPISGTKIRTNPFEYWEYLSPVVRSSHVKRVVIYGGESTGKTTLAKALAEKFNTSWVPEYGRQVYEAQGFFSKEDIIPTMAVQLSNENMATFEANKILFCDTSPLTTLCYSELMFDGYGAERLKMVGNRKYDGIILCSPDFDFIDDGTRVSTEFSKKQDQWYRDRISGNIFEAKGSLEERILTTSTWIKETVL